MYWLQYLLVMDILSSFKQQETLNKDIWQNANSPSKSKMNPKVRERLLEIAYEYQEFLEVDVVVEDVHMTGSLSNYNWSKYSDVDLHLIVDFNQIPKDQLDLYQELFKMKKTLFNLQHNIKIYEYDVELYVQDSNEEHTSSGVYSVLHDEWIVEPKKEKFELDKKLLMQKVESWKEKIDNTIEDAKEESLEIANERLGKLKEKIKEYRTSGLKKGGEYSYENLVFKFLRRNGYIQKLFDFQIEKFDKELSLKEIKNYLKY